MPSQKFVLSPIPVVFKVPWKLVELEPVLLVHGRRLARSLVGYSVVPFSCPVSNDRIVERMPPWVFVQEMKEENSNNLRVDTPPPSRWDRAVPISLLVV